MSKPILIIRCPHQLTMAELSKVGEGLKHHKDLKEEYHILVVTGQAEEFRFDGVYPKDFDVMELEAVKKRLNGELIEILK